MVVIGVPVYNEESFIKKTLDSIACQTWNDFAVLIADNHSTDSTYEICREYANSDNRFFCVRHDKNYGARFNLDFLLRSSESPFFMYLGGHDLLDPDFLRMHLSAMIKQPNISLSCSSIQWADEHDNLLKISIPRSISNIKGSGFQKYLKAVTSVDDSEYNVINSLVRRKCLDGVNLDSIFGMDHILLSRLSYTGDINFYEESLYFARAFAQERGQTWMERVDPINPEKCADFSLFVKAYLSDFDKIDTPNNLEHKLKRIAVLVAVKYRILLVKYRVLIANYEWQKNENIRSFWLFLLLLFLKKNLGKIKDKTKKLFKGKFK